MNYSCYFNGTFQRWQGEDVPGECDYLGCYEDIDLGPSFACTEPDCECGMFFCYNHLGYIHDENSAEPKPDSVEWLEQILTEDRWETFRENHPHRVGKYREIVEEF